MNYYGRTATRLYESMRLGADYGCAVQRYEKRMPLHEKALYVVAVIALIVVAMVVA